jgi:hypothetical protein
MLAEWGKGPSPAPSPPPTCTCGIAPTSTATPTCAASPPRSTATSAARQPHRLGRRPVRGVRVHRHQPGRRVRRAAGLQPGSAPRRSTCSTAPTARCSLASRVAGDRHHAVAVAADTGATQPALNHTATSCSTSRAPPTCSPPAAAVPAGATTTATSCSTCRPPVHGRAGLGAGRRCHAGARRQLAPEAVGHRSRRGVRHARRRLVRQPRHTPAGRSPSSTTRPRCSWPTSMSAPSPSGTPAPSGSWCSPTAARRRSCPHWWRVEPRFPDQRRQLRRHRRHTPVPPGGTCTVNLMLMPSIAGPVTGTLTVSEAGFDAVSITSQISGLGGDPSTGCHARRRLRRFDWSSATRGEPMPFSLYNVAFNPVKHRATSRAGLAPDDFQINLDECSGDHARCRAPRATCRCCSPHRRRPPHRQRGGRHRRRRVRHHPRQRRRSYDPKLAVSSTTIMAGSRLTLAGAGFAATRPGHDLLGRRRWHARHRAHQRGTACWRPPFVVRPNRSRPVLARFVAQTADGHTATADVVVVGRARQGGPGLRQLARSLSRDRFRRQASSRTADEHVLRRWRTWDR